MKALNVNCLLLALAGVFLLSGCVHSRSQSTANGLPVPRQVSYADLDRACAQLVVGLVTDPAWNAFAEQYAQRVRTANDLAGDLECVPLMFLSEVKNGLTTRGGRPVNVSYLTGKFKELTGNPWKLQEYLAELPQRFPAEAARLNGWTLKKPALPCIRWSAYIGRDKEQGIAGIDFIVHDPRVEQHGVEKGKILPPGIAFTVEMTQNTLDQTRYIFHARIVDFLKTNGTTGEGVTVWESQISLP